MAANPESLESRPFVSLIVPCRNEAGFIGACLASIVANDYPKSRLEVIIIDGMSDDGTREVVAGYSRRHPFVRLVSNPKRITPAGLNAGIREARGEIIMRMDAHAHLAADYISRAVDGLQAHGADNVGGIMHTRPQVPGTWADAIVAAISHRFGVGNSFFRVHTDRPTVVDTVFGGCYRRDVFDRVGLFNEALSRGQDMEFNLRLKKIGGRTLLLPDVVSYYYARSDVGTFWRHNWNNGVWAIVPFARSTVMPVSWRHLVPLIFVSTVIALAVASIFVPAARWLLAAVFGSYLVAAVGAAIDIARRERRLSFLATMPPVFLMLHAAYGLGSLVGVFRAAVEIVRRKLSAPADSGSPASARR